MTFATAFAAISERLSERYGGPFHAAVARTDTDPVYDSGGSILTPGGVLERPCKVQIDSATEAMRGDEGFTIGDVRLLVLAATLTGALNTDARVEVTEGPHAGAYSVQTCSRDPFGVYWECRGRPA